MGPWGVYGGWGRPVTPSSSVLRLRHWASAFSIIRTTCTSPPKKWGFKNVRAGEHWARPDPQGPCSPVPCCPMCSGEQVGLKSGCSVYLEAR